MYLSLSLSVSPYHSTFNFYMYFNLSVVYIFVTTVVSPSLSYYRSVHLSKSRFLFYSTLSISLRISASNYLANPLCRIVWERFCLFKFYFRVHLSVDWRTPDFETYLSLKWHKKFLISLFTRELFTFLFL